MGPGGPGVDSERNLRLHASTLRFRTAFVAKEHSMPDHVTADAAIRLALSFLVVGIVIGFAAAFNWIRPAKRSKTPERRK